MDIIPFVTKNEIRDIPDDLISIEEVSENQEVSNCDN